jgi:hypothetical protein
MLQRCLFLPLFLFALPLPSAPLPIVTPAKSSPNESLAAHEVRRYIYLRTGELPPIQPLTGRAGKACVFVGRKDQPETRALAGEASALEAVEALKPQEYLLKTTGANSLLIVGGDDAGVLYGGYAFAEKLGVRFYLHGDVAPDGRIAFSMPELNETGKPLFELRGIQTYHDFPEGPDWWSTDDYLAYISQLAKMRMNFLCMHCFPECRNGPEPLVWTGPTDDLDEKGNVTRSYPSFWANTLTPKEFWGYTPTKTSDFAGGASLLFAGDTYGSEVQAGMMPRPKTPQECNEVFNRAAALLHRAFAEAKALGVKTCIGTETPLTIPTEVKERLKSQGKKPEDPATVREVYSGTFARIERACPVDYYCLWTPEDWTWSGNSMKQFEETTRDIQAALEADKALGNPFKIATSGWVLGPQHDRTALDKVLPKDVPMSCINQHVGYNALELSFANVVGRPKWAIPWLENDPTLTQPQPWVGRMRYEAADAKRLGCTGLLGVLWRTKAIMQNVSALAAAAWDQSWIPASFDPSPIPPQPPSDGALGGTAASFDAPVAETGEAPVYQTVRYDTAGYYLAVPDGTYSVTLKFNEPFYSEAGKRVFGVDIQGRPVIQTLDIFAKAGKNKALDFTFKDIAVTNGALRIDFTRQVEFPCIGGIVIEGKTGGANQLAGQPFTRKINCGGGKFRDYEADPVAGSPRATAGKDRGMPMADFYADFARANFGANVAAPAGEIMASVDGLRMPKITAWVSGPGCILVNEAPWKSVKQQFEFVDGFAALRAQVGGAGNLGRFDYWLNTYRAAECMARVGCMRGELDRAAAAMKKEQEAAQKKKLAAEALALRIELAREWAQLLSLQTALTDTPGELGTIANLEMQNRRTGHLLDEHDPELVASLGAPLPAEATPSMNYNGAARIIVPTVRTQIEPGESLNLKVIVLDNQPAKAAALFWRKLGPGGFKKVNLRHIARAVYSVTLPAAKEDFEYYISAKTASGEKLVWPATAPAQNQTVVLL